MYDVNLSPDISMLIEEAGELELINKALKRQIQLNQERLAEIDKVLANTKEVNNG